MSTHIASNSIRQLGLGRAGPPSVSAQKTLLREKADEHQDRCERTTDSIRAHGKTTIAMGILGIVAEFVIVKFPWTIAFIPIVGKAGYVVGRVLTDSGEADAFAYIVLAVFSAFTLLCFAVVVAGIRQLIRAARIGTKPVSCPGCRTSLVVLRSVTAVMCPSCGGLIRLGLNGTASAHISACSYCGLNAMMSTDCVPFPCSNCGLMRGGATTDLVDDSGSCPSCEAAMPERAAICVACGQARRPVFRAGVFAEGFDFDWLIGKDAVGHLRLAEAVLETIDDAATEATSLLDLAVPFRDLEWPLVLVEQAAATGATQDAVRATLERIESGYVRLLVRELALIAAAPDATHSRNQRTQIMALVNPPYLKARRRVEMRLSHLLPSSEAWAETLIAVNQTSVAENYKVANFGQLEAEVAQRARREPASVK